MAEQWNLFEHWRPVPGYPDYEASSFGRVRRATGGKGARRGHVLTQHEGGGSVRDYLRVRVCTRGKAQTLNVHKLVAMAFHGDKRPLTVDHVNGDTRDNRPENLRWISGATNYRLGALKRWGHEPPPPEDLDGTSAHDIEVGTERGADDIF